MTKYMMEEESGIEEEGENRKELREENIKENYDRRRKKWNN